MITMPIMVLELYHEVYTVVTEFIVVLPGVLPAIKVFESTWFYRALRYISVFKWSSKVILSAKFGLDSTCTETNRRNYVSSSDYGRSGIRIEWGRRFWYVIGRFRCKNRGTKNDVQ